jgi:hypothetical protein
LKSSVILASTPGFVNKPSGEQAEISPRYSSGEVIDPSKRREHIIYEAQKEKIKRKRLL